MLVFNFHHCEQEVRHPERRHITISPRGLQRTIQTLRFLGFEIVALQDVLKQGAELIDRPKTVVFTFDDGYVNNMTEALAVLEAESCPATIFALPGLYGGTNQWDQGHLPPEQRDQLMTRYQLECMISSEYITLGSHGLTHQDFTKLSDAALHDELMHSYEILKEDFGPEFLPVIAYPWGYYGQREIEALKATPYQYAFTVNTKMWESTDPAFEIPRFSAYYRDGNPLIFTAKLLRHRVLTGALAS